MRTDYQEIDLGRLVQIHAPLVQRIAWHMAGRLPSNVSMDDLFQNGMLGLFDSAARYQAGMGAEFETFVSQRIRGPCLMDFAQMTGPPGLFGSPCVASKLRS